MKIRRKNGLLKIISMGINIRCKPRLPIPVSHPGDPEAMPKPDEKMLAPTKPGQDIKKRPVKGPTSPERKKKGRRTKGRKKAQEKVPEAPKTSNLVTKSDEEKEDLNGNHQPFGS